MAIIKNTQDHVTYSLFAGRVLKVEKTVETRNWSDTLDYSDYRTTNCTYALVWLGTHGLPPSKSTTRPMAHYGSVRSPSDHMPDYLAAAARDLEFFEQFAWVDCTNLFSDRNGYTLAAAEDALGGEPLMWANYIAWQAYMDSAREAAAAAAAKKAEAIRLVEEEKAAKAAARAAAAEAKLAATKDEAAVLMAKLPPKGTKVTVKGVTGQLFWTGIKAYRGVNSARIGVKDSTGTAHWFSASDLVG